MLSIVHILEKNRFDTGSVHQMFQAASGQRERGHEVTIVGREDSNLAARAREAGVRFVPAPFASDVDVRTIAIIRKVVRERSADVVHVHKGRPHTLALAATWRRPVAAFVVNRGVSFPLTFWNRAKYRTPRVDRVVAVCEQIRQVVIRSGRLAPSKVDVIYAGTDTREFDPGRWDGREFRREKSIPDGALLVMQVGVRDWKGWRDLVEAMALVKRARPEAHLALVGCREETPVRDLAAARGVPVTPVEVREDMPRVLAAADCVVDASWAGTGITGTIREAMAMARPVVATDCGGNRELVSAPDCGWLVPPRDHEALSGAILQVLADESRAAGVGRNARARVEQQFSKEARLERLESLYRSIIAAKR